MILYINTKDARLIEVGIKKEGEFIDKLSDENQYGSQSLLPLIKKLLEKNNLVFKDIQGIEVEKKGESFTGLKVGVSVANALGFALGVKVNKKDMEVDLIYS